MDGIPIQNPSSIFSLQSQKDQLSSAVASGPDSKPKKKICCACPDTKKLRDECIVEHGESACEKWIEVHRKCLRAEGFNVRDQFVSQLQKIENNVNFGNKLMHWGSL